MLLWGSVVSSAGLAGRRRLWLGLLRIRILAWLLRDRLLPSGELGSLLLWCHEGGG